MVQGEALPAGCGCRSCPAREWDTGRRDRPDRYGWQALFSPQLEPMHCRLASAKHLLLRWPREIGGAMEYEWSGSWYVCPPRRMTVASWPAEARSSTSLSRSLRGSSRRLAFIGRSHRSELAREYRRPSGLASGTVICRTSVVARSNRPASIRTLPTRRA